MNSCAACIHRFKLTYFLEELNCVVLKEVLNPAPIFSCMRSDYDYNLNFVSRLCLPLVMTSHKTYAWQWESKK